MKWHPGSKDHATVYPYEVSKQVFSLREVQKKVPYDLEQCSSWSLSFNAGPCSIHPFRQMFIVITGNNAYDQALPAS